MRSLRALTFVVTAMVAIDAVWSPIVLLYLALFPASFQLHVTPIAGMVDGAALAFKIATMVVFGWWIYAAGANLVDADVEDLDFTPASRIWWFAVPFANFVKPFQGMRELWNASRNVWPLETNNSIVSIWWALWLAAGIFSWFARFIANDAGNGLTVLYVISAIVAARAVVAIILIRGIADGQRRLGGEGLSEVFA